MSTLREKCPYSELFWSAISRIWTEYGEISRITPNTDTFYAIVLEKVAKCAKKQARARVLLNRNFFLDLDRSVLWKLIVNKKGPPFEIFLWDKVNICLGQNFTRHNEIHFLYLTNVRGATIDTRRARICAYFYWRMHDFEETYVGTYTQVFSMIGVNWDMIRGSSFSKKQYFYYETYSDNLIIICTTWFRFESW